MLNDRISAIDGQLIADQLNDTGYAVVPQFFNRQECLETIAHFDDPNGYRKTVTMERHRFGRGCYKYWDYPLPDRIQNIRSGLYPKLVPIANAWMQALKQETRFAPTYADLQKACAEAGQTKPTALILKYGPQGYNTLHQDLYGEVYFPLQAAIFLSAPNQDYTGGEFVLTEQVPRAQSKATVLIPQQGDMVIFTTNFRPILGTRGYYRATMRHGVSPIHTGERYCLGIIFHDAKS